MRLIDADALKKVFHAEWDDVLVWDESGETTADEFCNLVDAAPTIEAEPVKRGKWFYDEIADEYLVFRCSACDIPSTLDTPYCPWCGAKMNTP